MELRVDRCGRMPLTTRYDSLKRLITLEWQLIYFNSDRKPFHFEIIHLFGSEECVSDDVKTLYFKRTENHSGNNRCHDFLYNAHRLREKRAPVHVCIYVIYFIINVTSNKLLSFQISVWCLVSYLLFSSAPHPPSAFMRVKLWFMFGCFQLSHNILMAVPWLARSTWTSLTSASPLHLTYDFQNIGYVLVCRYAR